MPMLIDRSAVHGFRDKRSATMGSGFEQKPLLALVSATELLIISDYAQRYFRRRGDPPSAIERVHVNGMPLTKGMLRCATGIIRPDGRLGVCQKTIHQGGTGQLL